MVFISPVSTLLNSGSIKTPAPAIAIIPSINENSAAASGLSPSATAAPARPITATSCDHCAVV